MCSATYFLEGDYILAPFTYETVVALLHLLSAQQWPSVDAFIATQPLSVHASLRDQARAAFAPVLKYFRERFDGEDAQLATEMEFFKYARLAAPDVFVVYSGTFPTPAEVLTRPAGEQKLFKGALPFIREASVKQSWTLKHAALVAEMPKYAGLAASFKRPSPQGKTSVVHMKEVTEAMLAWWKANEMYLPNWALFARKVFLVQPSSATVERVFSILNRIYTKDRYSSLNDMIELSCMLAFNAP